jgi:thiamine pyrophosphate-dependent acetolactate synthase large subunit-like protein
MKAASATRPVRTTPVQLEQRAHDARREAITAALRERMRPFCATVPEDMFFEMIERMADIQLKSELLEQRPSD